MISRFVAFFTLAGNSEIIAIRKESIYHCDNCGGNFDSKVEFAKHLHNCSLDLLEV
jgi:hypothetical protein